MEILGVGVSELVFIVIIMLIVLGPRDMQKAGKTIGKWLNSIVKSDGWKVLSDTSRELRTLPNKLMREANFDQLTRSASTPDPKRVGAADALPNSKPYSPNPALAAPTENKIAPHDAEQKETESDPPKNA